jgi:predicted O-methyltransferase YrrM
VKIEKVLHHVDGIPVMSYAQAKTITEFILSNQSRSILELGFKHGVSTCYIAGALEELGGGSVTTIDLVQARTFQPNIEQLLQRIGLEQYVKIYYEPTSYLWRLMKMLEENSEPLFDLCYLDGAHTWNTDGFAFFLVDRLLKPGGWIIFDDLDWTFAQSMADDDNVKKMPKEQKETPQVRKIYELLVKSHPDYGNFMIRDNWAYAQKIKESRECRIEEFKKETIVITERVGIGSYLEYYTKKMIRLISKMAGGKKRGNR